MNQHTLLVVHGAPPSITQAPALVARLRRYFHPGNVLRSWSGSASFSNWLRRASRDEESTPPIALVMTRGTFEEVHAAFLRIGTMPSWDFLWVVVHWDHLVDLLEATPPNEPLVFEQNNNRLEFSPLPRGTGKYAGYTLSGPFMRAGSLDPAHQAVYALGWLEEQERYRGVKVEGRGGRVLHWEEADITAMVLLGYIRHHLAVRVHVAQLHTGKAYNATVQQVIDAAGVAIEHGLLKISDVKVILAGLGVNKLTDISQNFVITNMLALMRAVIGGAHVRERLRILYGLPFGGHRMALICSEAQREAIRIFDEKDIKTDTNNVPLPGFVRLRAPEPVAAATYDEPVSAPYVIEGEHDNTSWTRVIREHAGAHYTLASTRWDISWNRITGFYEAERSEDKTIVACIRPTDLRNMIATGKLVAFRAGATTPYPDLDTFNQRVMNHPKERRLERNSVLRMIAKGLTLDKHGTEDVPSNKRKAIMDELKYRLEHYPMIRLRPAYINPNAKLPSVDKFSENILRDIAQATGLSYEELTSPIPPSEDVYAKFAAEMRNTPIRGEAAGERKVGMPYGSAREAMLGKEGAWAQRDEAAKRAADAKAAAFPCVVHAGWVTARGEMKRLIARVSHVTAGVISATMAGTNSWRKGQDNTHLELIRNSQIDRTHFGYEKYGVTLDRDDLSLAQLDQHAFEEAMDLVCYLRARIRAMNKISGNGTEYGPDEEWIEPLVKEAHNLLEGLARQVLRTNPEANKLSQYVELEEPFSDAGKARLFDDLKAGRVQTVHVDFETRSKAPFATGGVYTGTGNSDIFGERGPEMVISKSQAERFEEKLKNFRTSYNLGPLKIREMRVLPDNTPTNTKDESMSEDRNNPENLNNLRELVSPPERRHAGNISSRSEQDGLLAGRRLNAPRAGVTFGSDYGAADTISGFSTESLLHVLRANEAAARDFFWAFHQLSKNGGWWNDLNTGETLLRNRGEMLCLIHSEISEAMEGERKNRNDDHLPDRKQAEVELADAQIRIADYCSGFGYDVIGAMVEKARYNSERADHKPENRKAENGKQF